MGTLPRTTHTGRELTVEPLDSFADRIIIGRAALAVGNWAVLNATKPTTRIALVTVEPRAINPAGDTPAAWPVRVSEGCFHLTVAPARSTMILSGGLDGPDGEHGGWGAVVDIDREDRTVHVPTTTRTGRRVEIIIRVEIATVAEVRVRLARLGRDGRRAATELDNALAALSRRFARKAVRGGDRDTFAGGFLTEALRLAHVHSDPDSRPAVHLGAAVLRNGARDGQARVDDEAGVERQDRRQHGAATARKQARQRTIPFDPCDTRHLTALEHDHEPSAPTGAWAAWADVNRTELDRQVRRFRRAIDWGLLHDLRRAIADNRVA